MTNLYARLSVSATAGAIAGIIQTLVIIGLSEIAVFQLLGTTFRIDFRLAYIYQRACWGAIWGLLFVIPIFKSWPNTSRGLVFAAGPACASLFYFLPFYESNGWLGLNVGVLWPVIVVVFALLWGYVAGAWLDRVYGLVKE